MPGTTMAKGSVKQIKMTSIKVVPAKVNKRNPSLKSCNLLNNNKKPQSVGRPNVLSSTSVFSRGPNQPQPEKL